jgi:hypothetical protein
MLIAVGGILFMVVISTNLGGRKTMPKIHPDDFSDEPKTQKHRPTSRPIFCDCCKSHNIVANMNVGWDIDEEMEEHQHVDKCNDCGAVRMWSDIIPHSGAPWVAWGIFEKNKYSSWLGY